MSVLIGKVKSGTVTLPSGAVPLEGARVCKVTKNFGTTFDHDPMSDEPDAYQGNQTKRVSITLRDRELAVKLFASPWVDSLNIVLAKPKMAKDGSAAYADSVTVAGTNLVVDGDIESAAASPDNLPGEYTVDFVVSKDGATKGTLTVTPSGAA